MRTRAEADRVGAEATGKPEATGSESGRRGGEKSEEEEEEVGPMGEIERKVEGRVRSDEVEMEEDEEDY